ncbi:hypothetical protein ATANTOWER_013330, partial [Ataeniobius toweri]|nr:hypothetical protein [Ataeniobius toweri]
RGLKLGDVAGRKLQRKDNVFTRTCLPLPSYLILFPFKTNQAGSVHIRCQFIPFAPTLER